MSAFWALETVLDVIKSEYGGWRNFQRATGKWPVCSILAGIFSIPACFVSGGYLFIRVLETGRLPLIYTMLFVILICSAAAWYGLRRLACKVDVVRAQKSGRTLVSSETLETYIR